MDEDYEREVGVYKRLQDILEKISESSKDFAISFSLANAMSVLAYLYAKVDQKIHPTIKDLKAWEALFSGNHFVTWLYLKNPFLTYAFIVVPATILLYLWLKD